MWLIPSNQKNSLVSKIFLITSKILVPSNKFQVFIRLNQKNVIKSISDCFKFRILNI